MKNLSTRITCLLILMTALCGAGVRPAAAAPDSKLEGWVLHNGQTFPVDLQHVTVKAERCSDPSNPTITVKLLVKPDPTKPQDAAKEEPVVQITGDLTRVKLGQVILPASTLDARTGANLNPPASIVAWTTWRLIGKIQPKKPNMGLIQFVQLQREGPIEVKFEANFEGNGHVKGHLIIDQTVEVDCKP